MRIAFDAVKSGLRQSDFDRFVDLARKSFGHFGDHVVYGLRVVALVGGNELDGRVLVRHRLACADRCIGGGCTSGGAPVTTRGWFTRTIAPVLYPFAAGAMATNVFFASLIGSWVGMSILSSLWSVGLGALIGLPATWAFASYIRTLMDKSET